MYRFDGLLRNRLTRHIAAHERRAVEQPSLKRSAVAIVVCEGDSNEACYLITRRAASLRRNAGQWALPGGRMDGSETSAQTACRELEEELGVSLDAGAALGLLDDMPARSGFAITPVVFWAPHSFVVRPNPAEVAFAWRVPLADLDHPEAPRDITMPVRGHWINPPTAAILLQFRDVALHGRSTRVAHIRQPDFTAR
jgi:8-oxo-dGTP pyrophosphatase MutT (NUDIX family)